MGRIIHALVFVALVAPLVAAAPVVPDALLEAAPRSSDRVHVATDVDDDPARVFGPVNTRHIALDGELVTSSSKGDQEGAFASIEFRVLNDQKWLLVGGTYVDLSDGDLVLVEDFEGRYFHSWGERVGRGNIKLDGLAARVTFTDSDTGETIVWPQPPEDPPEEDPCAGDADCDGIPDAEDPCPTGACPDPDPCAGDADCDGLPDESDPCPDNPDCDGDGQGDSDDACPTGDCVQPGCPDDSDCDGVPDGSDPCPTSTDCDGDGIPDGSDPCPTSTDCDGDGIPDGSDPCPTSTDCDGDGIPDGSDPCPASADCDGDGLPDPDEGVCGTDPLVPDTDGDGLTDGEECGGATDPLHPDTDRCGLSDGDEVLAGTDPRNPWDDVRLSLAPDRDEYLALEDRPVLHASLTDALGRPVPQAWLAFHAVWRTNTAADVAVGAVDLLNLFEWAANARTNATGDVAVLHRGPLDPLGVVVPTVGHEDVLGEHLGSWDVEVWHRDCARAETSYHVKVLAQGDVA